MHIRYVSSEGFFMRKKFLIYIAIAFALALVFTMSLDNQQKNLSEKLIRLHVVGATDSQEDQKLKLKVKDEIVSQVDMVQKQMLWKYSMRIWISLQRLPSERLTQKERA